MLWGLINWRDGIALIELGNEFRSHAGQSQRGQAEEHNRVE